MAKFKHYVVTTPLQLASGLIALTKKDADRFTGSVEANRSAVDIKDMSAFKIIDGAVLNLKSGLEIGLIEVDKVTQGKLKLANEAEEEISDEQYISDLEKENSELESQLVEAQAKLKELEAGFDTMKALHEKGEKQLQQLIEHFNQSDEASAFIDSVINAAEDSAQADMLEGNE